MKPIRLLTPILVAATVVISSCSAPRLAQQGSGNDDVYNSVAKAQEYVQPQPGQSSQYSDSYDDDYGSSDPNYDMDYSSRINRFYYGSPYRNYYDPYYGDYYGYNGFSPYSSSWSLGFGWGFGNYYNSMFNPYFGYGGWGYSPYWGYNPYWGGGFWGGGYWGGGYWGGGYVNRLPGNTTYGARPYRGRENGVGYTPRSSNMNSSYNGRGVIRTTNGVSYTERSRSSRPANVNSGSRPDNPYIQPRQGRTESYTPQRDSRPSYSPPSNSGGNYGGGGGGGGRSQRGGRN